MPTLPDSTVRGVSFANEHPCTVPPMILFVFSQLHLTKKPLTVRPATGAACAAGERSEALYSDCIVIPVADAQPSRNREENQPFP
jgi:hypothetical protein